MRWRARCLEVGAQACAEEDLLSQCLPRDRVWEELDTCECVGREVLCAHVEGLLCKVHEKGDLLSAGPRAGL